MVKTIKLHAVCIALTASLTIPHLTHAEGKGFFDQVMAKVQQPFSSTLDEIKKMFTSEHNVNLKIATPEQQRAVMQQLDQQIKKLKEVKIQHEVEHHTDVPTDSCVALVSTGGAAIGLVLIYNGIHAVLFDKNYSSGSLATAVGIGTLSASMATLFKRKQIAAYFENTVSEQIHDENTLQKA